MNFCKKHPQYKGKGKPKHKCLTCLNLYSKLGMIRKPIAPPNKPILSKKEKLNSRQKIKLAIKKINF